MASSDSAHPSAPTALPAELANVLQLPRHRADEATSSSSPVEMSQLQPHPHLQEEGAGPSQIPIIQTSPLQSQQPSTSDGAPTPTTSIAAAQPLAMPTFPPPAAMRPDQSSIPPTSDSSGIGPPSEGPLVASEAAGGPALLINLLLTTGARHPYTIDQKYLRKRNVATADEDVDPFAISVYTLKELIWRDWREEWESRPTSPSAIRLIHFGKLLDDKSSLQDCRFQPSIPNVVHMTIKPQDMIDDEENAKAGKPNSSRSRDAADRESGCRCCLIQ